MAAPPEITLDNLNCKFIMDKTLSDDSDPILVLQGIGWFLRKAIGLATVYLDVKEYVDEEGVTHIDISQTATGGIKGTKEERKLTWTDGEHEDGIFGKVIGKSRFYTALDMQGGGSEEELKFLKAEILKDGSPSKWLEDDKHIQSWARSVNNGWTAEQTWGFEEINGKRYYTRRVVCRKGDKSAKARLVYAYQK